MIHKIRVLYPMLLQSNVAKVLTKIRVRDQISRKTVVKKTVGISLSMENVPDKDATDIIRKKSMPLLKKRLKVGEFSIHFKLEVLR